MKINILTGISLFLCVTLQGTQNEDQENKDLLILDTFLINKYDRNKIQNVNCRDQWGKTPLTFESTEGNEENVKFLLENGAKHNLLGENLIEGTTKVGIYEDKKVFFVYPTTALNEASKNGHKGCMQLLIKYGAKPFKINKYYAIPKNKLNSDWHHEDENKAAINYAAEQGRTDCVKMLFEYAIQQDKQLDEKVLLKDYIKAVSQATSYKEYVGEKSYKEYLQKNITFLLLVNKFSPHKSVHHPRLLLPKALFLENIVRPNLYNTYPVLSEGLKVGSPSLSLFSPQDITDLFNYYKKNYEHCFPENSFIKYVEPKFFDKCISF